MSRSCYQIYGALFTTVAQMEKLAKQELADREQRILKENAERAQKQKMQRRKVCCTVVLSHRACIPSVVRLSPQEALSNALNEQRKQKALLKTLEEAKAAEEKTPNKIKPKQMRQMARRVRSVDCFPECIN